MLTIAGYQIEEKIYESTRSIVYRAHQHDDTAPAILKVLKHTYPSPEKIAWFQREFELIRSLNQAGVAGIILAHSLEIEQHQWMMVLEDFGGESLSRLKLAGSLSLRDFLALAINITTILAHIHQHQIMHKDINPSNILLNPQTGQVKLIDFSISTRLSRENTVFRNPDRLEGTLAYLSPEQTGRMNRAIDYRTDFYSLGATLYELLTGQPPFLATSTLELVHAHIAKSPPAPQEVRPDIPPLLAQIVLKLLAKNAEDRYQSALGLLADLEKCQRRLTQVGQIEPFALAQHDRPIQLQLPQKLYGRERDIAELLLAFERASRGGRELMLVAGYAGIGKTALVQEVYKPLTRRQGYFLAGKFDQLQRATPYTALVEAFRGLLRQLLTESETAIAAWRERILAAVEPNGQVIAEIIPEVTLIIGAQPAVPHLGPTEAQNRFNLVFQNFIRAFTAAEHPLVLFLDDLQWADAASLQLLRLLMTDSQAHHLFVIGTYRDNEVSAGHPLLLTLDAIQQAGTAVPRMALDPLSLLQLSELLQDTLGCPSERARPLAELVLTKTGGNPFFINEFLKSLYAENLLTFQIERGGWEWDLERLWERDITGNVIDLLTRKARRLRAETRQMLKLAACIGNHFDLATLAIVAEQTARNAAMDLWEGLAEGLVVPLSDSYKVIEQDVPGLAEAVRVEYSFAHDRVQQAVYSLIEEQERRAIHRRVGQLLLQNTPEQERQEQLFEIVDQLNRGGAQGLSAAEREELAELNVLAGQKAKLSMAYQTALEYARAGLALLEAESWQTHYQLTLALHIEAAEAAYLSTDFDQAERLIDVVLERAQTVLDKVKVYEIRIQSMIAQHNLPMAVETACRVLKLLGVSLPEAPSTFAILIGYMRTRILLASTGIDSLLNLPVMTDPYKLAAMRILMNAIAPTLMAFPKLLPMIVFNMVKLSIEYGNAAFSACGYGVYGTLLCMIFRDIPSGYKFGILSLQLLEKFNATELKSKMFAIFYSSIKPWKDAQSETVDALLEGYRSGLECGDFEYAAHTISDRFLCSLYIGRDLATLEKEITTYNNVMHQIKQERVFHLNLLLRQFALNLMGRAKDPRRLIGESYDETDMLPRLIQMGDKATTCLVHLYKIILNYLFHAYNHALEYARNNEPYLEAVGGTVAIPVYRFYYCLVLLANYPTAPKHEQQHMMKQVVAMQKQIKYWAGHAPMNYQHKYELIEAERARVLGQTTARDHYDRAIALAQEHGFLNEEALANELAARFYLERDQRHLAQHYIRDARYAYLRWGALAKVKDVDTRYIQTVPQAIETFDLPIWDMMSTPDRRQQLALDLKSVIKAAQAISGEIVLDKLLDQLMRIVLENAGAQKSFLILERDSQLQIAALMIMEPERIEVACTTPVESSQELSLAVVQYVARTKKAVVLHDADRRPEFGNDPYIIAHHPKSICCLPLIYQSQLSGVLYLENSLAAAAFTPDRLEVLGLLSTQAAIALENARLFANLQRENAERQHIEDEVRTLNAELEQRVQARTAELAASEARQRLLLAQMPAILWSTDRDLRITSSDGAGLARLNSKPNQSVGFTLYESLRTDDPEAPVIAAHRRAIAGEAASYETEWQGRIYQGHVEPFLDLQGQIIGSIGIVLDITERKLAEREREQLIVQLQEALAGIKTLRGLLPICASCKKIRDDTGYWNQLETYIHAHSEAEFSHGICPECSRRLYPELYEDEWGGASNL